MITRIIFTTSAQLLTYNLLCFDDIITKSACLKNEEGKSNKYN